MALQFVAASTDRLYNDNTFPLVSTGYPLTIAAWCKSTTATGAGNVACFSDTGSTNNYFSVGRNGSAFRLAARGGGTQNDASISAMTVIGRWTFFVARCISATNRKISAINDQGLIGHATTGTSRSPTGLDIVALGCLNTSAISEHWDGDIAEFWYTATDIQPDAAQLQVSTLKTLAFRGPWALPRIAKDIIEYRAFRGITNIKGTSPGTSGTRPREVYFGAAPNDGLRYRVWNDGGSMKISPHPPLALNYQRVRAVKPALLLV